MSKNASTAPTAALTVFRLAALFTVLAVALGSVVCATGSGAACPTWPGCHPGQVVPHWQLSPVIEFTHRVAAIAVGPLVLAAALMSVRLSGTGRRVRALPWVALVGALVSGASGRLVVLSGLPTWMGAIDLFCALMVMITMTMFAVLLGATATSVTAGSAGRRRLIRTGRLAVAGVTVLVAMHVTGVFTAATGSYTRCLGWPLWRLIAGDLHPWLQGLRLGLAGLGAGLVVATAVTAARTDRLRAWGALLGTLFAAEMVAGLVIGARGLHGGLATGYSILAVALLWCLVLLTALAGTASVAPATAAPTARTGLVCRRPARVGAGQAPRCQSTGQAPVPTEGRRPWRKQSVTS